MSKQLFYFSIIKRILSIINFCSLHQTGMFETSLRLKTQKSPSEQIDEKQTCSVGLLYRTEGRPLTSLFLPIYSLF